MVGNYVNRFDGVCATGTDHPALPEAELWIQVILQAIQDLDGRTASTPRSAKDSAREWFASECEGVCSFLWTCQIINVDPSFIRSQLAKKLRMKKSDQVIAPMPQAAIALRRKDSPVPDNVERTERRLAFRRLAV